MLKGEVPDYILNESVRIKDDVEVGKTYLMMFTQDEDGYLMIAARNNAVIESGCDDYNKFVKDIGENANEIG